MKQISLGDINIHDIGTNIQIAGTVWSGKGISFITLFPGKDEDFSNLSVLPMNLEEWKRFVHQTDVQEVEILRQEPQGIVKSIVRKTQRQISAYIQWAVFKRDHYTCRYCGRDGIPLTIDHIDLWEEGGVSIEANLLTTCRSCNKDRGNVLYEIWIISDLYKKKSRNLPQAIKDANLALVNELPNLRKNRVIHKHSR